MDIHNEELWISIIGIMDMYISIYGYPQIELWISMNRIMDIHNRIIDIHNCFMDIHDSITDILKPIMDIKNSYLLISLIDYGYS